MTVGQIVNGLAQSGLDPNTEVVLYDPTEDKVLGTPELKLMVRDTQGNLWWSREEMADMEGVTPKDDVLAIRIEGENPLHL